MCGLGSGYAGGLGGGDIGGLSGCDVDLGLDLGLDPSLTGFLHLRWSYLMESC